MALCLLQLLRKTDWELSNSLDRMLEMTGRSVITAVVSTCLDERDNHSRLNYRFQLLQ